MIGEQLHEAHHAWLLRETKASEAVRPLFSRAATAKILDSSSGGRSAKLAFEVGFSPCCALVIEDKPLRDDGKAGVEVGEGGIAGSMHHPPSIPTHKRSGWGFPSPVAAKMRMFS